MNDDRYLKVDQLFDAAIDLTPQERVSFLDRACGSDIELRREVELLLDAYNKAHRFIETPAIEVAAQSLAEDSILSLTGKQIARYEIISLLGTGGMGEVYLADDRMMNRKVALKLLPVQFIQSVERVARFQRESRAASALNHPNIVTIYEMGQDRGISFIASEYVEGDTLRRRISKGMLTVNEAIEIAIQVSSALTAAHTAGIVHRDIKPENIMIRRDGYVKVLDFGLAKLTELGDSDSNQSASDHQTQSGTLLGTVNYMSPEQARGLYIDCRTDLFSLGIVLYEMVTGRQPFKEATVASTFDAILNKTPEPITCPDSDVPVELERIINRALEKDQDMRYQTASDFRAVLKRLSKSLDSNDTVSAGSLSTSGDAPHNRQVSHWWMKIAIAASLLSIILAGAWLFLPQRETTAEGTRWQDATSMKITDRQGEELFPSLAPDGKSVIYASRITGNYDIYLKKIGSRKIDNLTQDSAAQDTQPAFSRDGKRIAFRRSDQDGGGIFVMTETGELVRQLTSSGFNPSWSPDGKEIAYSEGNIENSVRGSVPNRLWIVNSTTGETRQLAVPDGVQPNWSPNGQRIAYWGVNDQLQRDIWTVSASGGEPVRVTDDSFIDWNPVWAPDGNHLYFVSNRKGVMNLWRVAIDQTSGIVKSAPELVPVPSSNTQFITFSGDGRYLAYVQTNYTQNIEKLSFDPVTEKITGSRIELTKSSDELIAPAISPDGQTVVCHSMGNIFSINEGNSTLNQITDEQTSEVYPVWSPDGKRIAYYSNRNGTNQIYIMNRDGSGLRQITEADPPGVVLPIWSPDGSQLAYSLHGGRTLIINLNKPWNEQTPLATPLIYGDRAHFVAQSWSPDGKYLVGAGYEGTIRRIGTFLFSIENRTYEPISESHFYSRWLGDSRRLISFLGEKVYLTDTLSRKPREIFSFTPDRPTGLDISKDNHSIYFSIVSPEADIWLLRLE